MADDNQESRKSMLSFLQPPQDAEARKRWNYQAAGAGLAAVAAAGAVAAIYKMEHRSDDRPSNQKKSKN